ESRDVFRTPGPEHLLLENDQRTRRRPEDLRAVTGAPESPRRVEHVDVWERRADRLQPMERVPRVQHRRVERLAVEADGPPRRPKPLGDRLEHRAFGRRLDEQML